MSCCGTNSCCGSSSGSDGLLKFSGLAGTSEGGGTFVSYLADGGVTQAVQTDPTNYPAAIQRTLKNLSVNIGAVTLSSGQSILVELLKDGTAVPGFNVSFGVGETGVKTNENTGRVTFTPGHTFALRVTTAGFSGSSISMAATIGVV